MATPALEVGVRRLPGLAIIDLRGEINAGTDQALNDAFAQATRDDSQVLLNFKQVNYISCTGITLIVMLLAQARRSGRRLHAFGLSEYYGEIFRITRLADFIRVAPDEKTAIGHAVEKKREEQK